MSTSAARNQGRSSLDQIGPGHLRPWFRAALVLPLAMPVALVPRGAGAGGAAEGGTEPLIGGWTWEAYAYAAGARALWVRSSLTARARFPRAQVAREGLALDLLD